MVRTIPVRNLYYLLLYAWNRLPEGGAVDVSGVEGPELPNLSRRSCSRECATCCGEVSTATTSSVTTIRLAHEAEYSSRETVSRQLLLRAQVACRVDELSRDVPHNRILKSTIARLARTDEVVPELREQLAALVRGLGDVAEVPLSTADFLRVQLQGNNAFYGFLLRVCALAHECLVPYEGAGRYRFRDLLADELAMGVLFQEFVRSFYRLEQREYRVGSEGLVWAIEPGFGYGHELLPGMQTDVTLRSATRTLVIECKWYREPLQNYYGRRKLRSGHLYQLFAYLKNLEKRGDREAEGILLYPLVDEAFDVACRIQDHVIRARTIDLSTNWGGIHDQLMMMIVGSVGTVRSSRQADL